MSSRIPLRRSLLIRYLTLVFVALMIWPIIFPLTSTILYYTSLLSNNEKPAENIYASAAKLEERWHQEAAKLNHKDGVTIERRLHELKQEYPEAKLFWVNQNGSTRLKLPEQPNLPVQWEAGDAITFMKQSYDGDPFTVIAFIGQDSKQGFMVMQIARSLMIVDRGGYNTTHVLIIVVLVFILFTAASWWFFYRLRNRLVRLGKAMVADKTNGLPAPIEITKWDEIGQLEHTFNQMIKQLTSSRQREQEEESLRKELIANLSHDLRTPLTTIRGHAHSLQHESLSEKGKQSLVLIDKKVSDLGHLVDNLLAYTLLSAHKYTLHPVPTDMLRLVRTSAASWYPIWEKEGFEVTIHLPEHSVTWVVDPQWMTRILDNLFQNVVRHAAAGHYVRIAIQEHELTMAIAIEDHGPGMDAASTSKGVGLGLTIVEMMTNEMKLHWEVMSSPEGTVMLIYPTALSLSL